MKGFFTGIDIATSIAQASILLNDCSPEIADVLRHASSTENEHDEGNTTIHTEELSDHISAFGTNDAVPLSSPSAVSNTGVCKPMVFATCLNCSVALPKDILRKCGINSVEDIPTCATLTYQLDMIRDTYASVTDGWLQLRRQHLHEEPPTAELGIGANQAFHTFLTTLTSQPIVFLNACLSLTKEQRHAILQLFVFDALTEFAQDHWPIINLLIYISKQVGNNADYAADRSLLSTAVQVCELICCRYEIRAFCATVAQDLHDQWSNLIQCTSKDELDIHGCRWLSAFAKALQRALSLSRCPIILCAMFNILASDAKNLGISPSHVATHYLLELCMCCCANLQHTMTTPTADLQSLLREVRSSSFVRITQHISLQTF